MEDPEEVKAEMAALLEALEPYDRQRVIECADKIKAIVQEYGEHGTMAIGFVGAIMSAELED